MTNPPSLDSPARPSDRGATQRRRSWRLTVGVPVITLVIVTIVLCVDRWVLNRRLSPAEMAQHKGALAGWNVLLISVDTLRADHLACYGYRRIKTPVIDRLADEGVRFVHAVSPVPLTLPSHATMLTGLNPVDHRVRNNGTFKLDAEFATLAELLAAEGYTTAAAVSAFVLDKRFGLAQGFEHYDDDLTVGDQPAQGGFRERRAELTNQAATRWLREQAAEPFFVFVHYFDPHWPYAPPSPYREEYAKAPYDGEIAYVDEQIGSLLAVLDETGARKRTLVVLTSDHGESLGEHGEMSHGIFVYDATQLVPLIVNGPSPLSQGEVIERQVGLVDIVPTVLDLLGLDRPPQLVGTNIFADRPDDRAIYVESLGAKLMHGCAPLLGVRRDDAKFIFAPKPELYDLRNDPREAVNLYDSHREWADRLGASLRGFVGDDLALATAAQSNLSLSEEAAARLRDLGYVIASSRPAATAPVETRPVERSLPDPKDMIVHLRRSQRAQQLITRGRFEEGFGMLEEHARLCPSDVLSMHRLAEGYRTVGRLTDALATYERILTQSGEDLDAMAGAGSVLLKLDRFDEAERRFRSVLSRDRESTSALIGLGAIQLARKRYQEALAIFRQVAERSGGSKTATAYSNIGSVYVEMGKTELARQVLQKALEIDPGHVHAAKLLAQIDQSEGSAEESIEKLRASLRRRKDPDGFLTLGRLLCQADKLDEAEDVLRKAMEQRPGHAETHYQLGTVLLSRSTPRAAEERFRRCIELDSKHAGARMQLGVILGQRGQLEQAVRWLSEAIKLDPAHARAHYNLGVALRHLGQVDRAMGSLRRSLELDPEFAKTHFNLGQLLVDQGKSAQAAEHFRKALALQPDYPEAKAALDRLSGGGR